MCVRIVSAHSEDMVHHRLLVAALGIGLNWSFASAQEFEFSCAAFPEAPSEEQLHGVFGVDYLWPDSIIGSDDGPFPGSVIFRESEDARIDVAWIDPERRGSAWWMRTRGIRWVTSQGLRVGDDLRSVEARNGWPFRLTGFIQEGGSGGQVLNWGRGRLPSLVYDGCREVLTFQHGYDDTTPWEVVAQVSFLDEVSSGHPAMQRINPRLVSIALVYPWRGAR